MAATPRGVDNDNLIATMSVVDLTDDDLFLSELPMIVKQELVNADLSNHVFERGVHFYGQEPITAGHRKSHYS